jgi:transposase
MADAEARAPSYEELLERNRKLEREVGDLRREVEKLRKIIETLQQSAKRQAAPFSKGKPKPDPNKCGRKPGEEYGRKGYRPAPTKVDETYRVPLPSVCPDPGCRGGVEFLKLEQQFQEEIPRRSIRRRFDLEIGYCSCCGRRVQGRHPLQTSDAVGAAGSLLGAEAQALAVHLNKDLGLSHGKVVRFFQTAFGISLSRGGSAQIMLRVAQRCEGAYRSILIWVRKSPVVYPDETGWRVAGLLEWLWTFVSQAATAYLIRPSRGFEVAEEVLGADFTGYLGHDGWAPYDNFSQARHQQCLAHIGRRCRSLLETAVRGAVRFPSQVKDLIQDALELRDRRDQGEISPHGLAVATGRLESRLDRLLTWKRSNIANERLAKHLDAHRDQIFTFLRNPGVEATNWPAEQSIRPAVVNRKVWGGNRTWHGAAAQSVLMSVLRTCNQRGRDGVDFLSRTLRAPSPRNLPRLCPGPGLG